MDSTLHAIIKVAPTMVAPVRSTRKPGRRPMASTRYVRVKISTAVRKAPRIIGRTARSHLNSGLHENTHRHSRHRNNRRRGCGPDPGHAGHADAWNADARDANARHDQHERGGGAAYERSLRNQH